VIAWPFAWYFLNKGLQNYAYHINLSWYFFVVSGLLTLAIALLTVSYQAFKSACTNPAEALKHE
jgi:putative ABC transport system permease protein